ncbi:P-loop containing nucleoside triphosphate hydrolase protein [Scenedesmus sp. NREL 46B-D3]|nr:P-loop containing nucleoside triphosphate hydrolase protein [Scenedesmus sp. NREL 46B-D3]
MAVPAYPHVYGLWTNKGGVGKTTMSYHLASTYAELFPDKVVVAIDMCPQANLSSTLLTNASVYDLTEYVLVPLLLLRCSANVVRLATLVQASSLATKLANHVRRESDREVVVFIDTNPALSIYTHIALVAMSELIIPVNADCFSMEAVTNMFRLLYGMYPSSGRVVAAYERTMFGFKARDHDIPVPKITAIVHNKTPVTKEAGAAGGGFQRPKVYRELANSHAGLLFDGYKRAADLDELDRVFFPRAGGPFNEGDMLVMMKTIFGDEVMNAADAAAVQRMEVLAAPARLAGDANDAAQGGVAGSDGADDEDDDGI